MHELFSCRNCVHNCSQTDNIGAGVGYCLQHDSILHAPHDTTCKYLHRKDLPAFIVDEGIREHASEYARFSGLVSLSSGNPLPRGHYSEKRAWESGTFDVIINALAQYHRTDRAWVFIEALSSGVDGRRSLTHVSLVRRYMDTCGTWASSYRLMLAYIQDLDLSPRFGDRDLLVKDGEDVEAVRNDAFWDVIFMRIAGVQEYGFHSGLEELMWATDSLGDALASFEWKTVQPVLQNKRSEWTGLIKKHATDEGVFFQQIDNESFERQNP